MNKDIAVREDNAMREYRTRQCALKDERVTAFLNRVRRPRSFRDYEPGEIFAYELSSLAKFKPALDGRTPSHTPNT